jgi:DNA-binding transcriptional ArsR family regulator
METPLIPVEEVQAQRSDLVSGPGEPEREPVNQTLGELPFEVRLRIYSAALHPVRMKILLELVAAGGSLSYTAIERKLKPRPNPNTLSFHLKKLQDAGLVTKTARHSEETRQYSTYMITQRGEQVVRVKDLTSVL